MSSNTKLSRLGLLSDADSLCPAAPRFVFVDGLLLNMLGNQRGSGLGGSLTVRVYFVVCGSVEPSGSKKGDISDFGCSLPDY